MILGFVSRSRKYRLTLISIHDRVSTEASALIRPMQLSSLFEARDKYDVRPTLWIVIVNWIAFLKSREITIKCSGLIYGNGFPNVRWRSDESDYLATLRSDQINIFSNIKKEIKIEKYDRRENHFTNKKVIYVSERLSISLRRKN